MAIKADPTIAKNVGLSISRKRELDQADDAKRNRLRTHSDSVTLMEYRRVSEENAQLLQHIAKLEANSVIL